MTRDQFRSHHKEGIPKAGFKNRTLKKPAAPPGLARPTRTPSNPLRNAIRPRTRDRPSVTRFGSALPVACVRNSCFSKRDFRDELIVMARSAFSLTRAGPSARSRNRRSEQRRDAMLRSISRQKASAAVRAHSLTRIENHVLRARWRRAGAHNSSSP